MNDRRLRVTSGPACGGHGRVLWLVLAALALAAAQPANAGPDPDSRCCARCDAVIVGKTQVAVTDFASREEHLYCNTACAVRAMMDKFPTARAVAHDPFAGKEVRVVRTGVKWVAWPKSAVFLYLPAASPADDSGQPQESGPTTSPKVAEMDSARRCLAFPRQVEYIQYLATHPEVAAHKPRPLRLPDLLSALRPQQDEQQDQDRTTAD